MTKSITAAAVLSGVAGLALAQPTVDGVYDPGTESAFYSDILWTNEIPTGFGDNIAGLFEGGDFGNPGDVVKGVEICIPLADLGLTGNETIEIAGWINSGDRTFMSNQIIGDLPIDTTNIGGSPDFTAAPFDTTTQHIVVDLSTAGTTAPTIDGDRTGDAYTNYFLQGNFTGFGDEDDGTIDGSGPGSGGSEIDGIYAIVQGGNLYLMVTGNLENNGNGLDIYIDTGAGGDNELDAGSTGDGAFVVDGQAGTVFDSAFDADFLVSVSAIDADEDELTPVVPVLYAGPIDGSIDLVATTTGYGTTGTGSGFSVHVDNSNTEGVIGTQSQATPVSPDANWAYGSELNNVRAMVDETNNKLYVFIAGNLEKNFNKLNLFFDCIAGQGQNTLRDDNVDIAFNNLNNVMGGITFDTGFEPDYWMDINTGVDGGSGELINFTDAATLRTDGALIDPTFLVVLDYGAFFGGSITDSVGTPVAMPRELMDFSGPRVDIQDGTLGALFTEYGPRLTQIDPQNPTAALIQTAIDNSNVAGVTGADASGAASVNTGIEICIDLDELGWDGSSDILMAGWIANDPFSFLSNQVFGELPAGQANLGEVDSDEDGMADLDFNTIAGDQFINLSAPPVVPCPGDFNGDGTTSFPDVGLFLAAFAAGDPAADFNGDGSTSFPDVGLFLAAFAAGCP